MSGRARTVHVDALVRPAGGGPLGEVHSISNGWATVKFFGSPLCDRPIEQLEVVADAVPATTWVVSK